MNITLKDPINTQNTTHSDRDRVCLLLSQNKKVFGNSNAEDLLQMTAAENYSELAMAIDRTIFLFGRGEINKPLAFLRSNKAFKNGKCAISVNGDYLPSWEREEQKQKREEQNQQIEAKKQKADQIDEELLKKYYNLPSEKQKKILDQVISELDQFMQKQYDKRGFDSLAVKANIESKIIGLMRTKKQ